MAVFGGFIEVVLFVVSILSVGTFRLYRNARIFNGIFHAYLIVCIVLSAECDNLLLILDKKSQNQTEFLILPGVKNTRIRCECSDQTVTETFQWYFHDGNEVPPQAHVNKNLQVHSRARGSLLFIPMATPSQEYVGGYRCASDGSNASINIVVKGNG